MDEIEACGGSFEWIDAMEEPAATETETKRYKYLQRHSQADTHKLGKLFPENVWLRILGKCERISRLSEASLYLRQLRQSHFNVIQFPAVLRLLFEHVYQYQLQTPTVLSQVLHLRTVCRHWKKTVDMLLPLQKSDIGSKTMLYPLLNWYTFRISGHLEFPRAEYCMNHFASTHQQLHLNPFCARTIRIVYYPEPGDDECINWSFNALQHLLYFYGRHVLHLSLEQETLVTPLSLRQHQLIQRLVKLMPNLKTIKLALDCVPGNKEERDLITFHRIPSLEQITIISATQLEDPIAAALLKSNGHIKRVIIKSPIYHKMLNRKFANLKELTVKEFAKGRSFLEFDRPKLKWPLEKLTLQISSAGLSEPQMIVDVINFNWRNTLKELAIDADEIRNAAVFRHANFDLPRLERLTLTFKRYRSWGFIAETGMTRTLKSLQLNYFVQVNRFTRVTKIFFNDVWMKALKNPQEADIIWKTFGKLRVLKCQDKGKQIHQSRLEDGKGLEKYRKWRKN